MNRADMRVPGKLRPFSVQRNYITHAEGSVLIEFGNTRVICTASCEESVPPFLRDSGTGWVTSEYGMLPRSCSSRRTRDASRGKIDGRTQEIQRLIGRSLRSVVDFKKLGERTIWIDCDVIQADGGTRTASITGGFIALADALSFLQKEKRITASPLNDFVAAISVGIVDGVPVVDLNYQEDSHAEVDMNVVMTGSGKFIEIQGTAEKEPFDSEQLDQLLTLARNGIGELVAFQKELLAS